MEELFEGAIIHFLALVLSMGVVYFAWKAKAGFGGKIGAALGYFFAGVVFLMLIHGSELIGGEGLHLFSLEHEAQEFLEHFLFYIGMILFMVSFSKMSKALIEAKNEEKTE